METMYNFFKGVKLNGDGFYKVCITSEDFCSILNIFEIQEIPEMITTYDYDEACGVLDVSITEKARDKILEYYSDDD